MGTREGARALEIGTGDLIAGNFADYVVLDATRIDPWSSPLNAVVYRAEDRWVQASFVSGRRAYTGDRSELARQAWEHVRSIARRLVE
jgi:cytosine/adenosine deaminase-related metal-dependent hydrolase